MRTSRQPDRTETEHDLDLVYGLEDRVPPGPAILIGVQQVAAMMVGTITPALLLSSVLKFSPQDTAYLVGMALLSSALGAFLQTMRFGIVGSGLLSITGTSFSFVEPLIKAGHAGGLPLMLGMSLTAVPVQLCLAPFLPRLKRVFSPLVSGIVVLLIGLSLIPVGMSDITKAPAEGAPVWGGALVALAVIGVILAVQAVGKVWARRTALFAGIVAGYAICGAAGWLHLPALAGGGWIAMPHLFPYGMAFQWDFLPPFAFIYLVCVLESVGDMTATAQLSGLKTEGVEFWNRLRGGVFADGLTCAASAICGSFPSSIYAQNNGVIQITGVAARRVGPVMAAMLAFLGLFPPVARWLAAMPSCVLGGLAVLVFGLVAVSGIRLISFNGLTQRDSLIAAISLGVGLGVPAQHQWLISLPHGIHTFFESGVSGGGLTALMLNLILPSREHKPLTPDGQTSRAPASGKAGRPAQESLRAG